MRVVKHRTGLPREGVEPPFLEKGKIQWDMVLDNLFWVSLLDRSDLQRSLPVSILP